MFETGLRACELASVGVCESYKLSSRGSAPVVFSEAWDSSPCDRSSPFPRVIWGGRLAPGFTPGMLVASGHSFGGLSCLLRTTQLWGLQGDPPAVPDFSCFPQTQTSHVRPLSVSVPAWLPLGHLTGPLLQLS